LHFPAYAVQTAVLGGSTDIFCRRKAALVSRKVAEGLRFDCGQCGSFTVFTGYMRFPSVVSGCETAYVVKRIKALNRTVQQVHSYKPTYIESFIIEHREYAAEIG